MNETGRASNWFTPLRFGALLALLIVAFFPQVLLGWQTFVVRDYGFFSYPNAAFQRDCFWHGELPFWNPYNECGVPFLAQWNTLALYPPSLIYLLLPLPWSLSFFCLLHLWLAGMGMYFLARRWTDNNFAAAFAGLAFSFNGLTLNLLMWPSHIATFAWMPWVVLAVESAWQFGGKKIPIAALVGTLQMLAGGPETIFLTWTLLAILWIRHFLRGDTLRLPTLWRFPLVVLLVAGLSAAQLLPFLDLASHSQRDAGYADLHWSMPATGWANFLVPTAFGNTVNMGVFFQHDQTWTSSYYPGIAALWLALASVWQFQKPRARLLAIIAVVSLIFAFGEHTPVYPFLYKTVPILSRMTYPIKYVLLLLFLLPLLAAFSLAGIQKHERIEKCFLRPGIVLLALIGLALFLVGRHPLPGDDIPAAIANGCSRIVFLLVIAALFFLLGRNRQPALQRWMPLLLLVIAWLDVVTHEPVQNPVASPGIYASDLVRKKLALDPSPEAGISRVMPTPASVDRFAHTATSIPENNFLVGRLGCQADCNLLDHIPKVDGFYSLVPHDWAPVRMLLYNESANVSQLEDFLGVCQVTATNDIYQWQSRSNYSPLITTGQKAIVADDTAVLQAMTQPDFDGRKVVYLAPAPGATNVPAARGRIVKTDFGNHRVEIDADASEPSVVVVAQTYYRHWQAFVDDRPATLFRANVAFQAVPIPAGPHHVRLQYIDRTFRAGLAVALVTLLVCAAMTVFCHRKKD
ncbi:MAG TPA: YfhO family protein [Desulfuromonadaceae bacterium]|nr:YfhO family protein [Desulfuromonadaceae bacterium]